MARRPNILWYCTDQQRFDTIAALGNPHIRTPNLDRLCGRGTAFRRAYCQSPICTPSRASFMTGRYPATTHVHRNGNAYFPPSEVLVSRILAEAGYSCGLVGKQHLSASKGHEKRVERDGYEVFEWSHHPLPNLDRDHHAYHRWLEEEMGVDPHALYDAIGGFCGPGVPAELHQTRWATERALCFAEARPDRPWMLNINVFDPHPPFDPPPDYLARYDPSRLPPPLFRSSDLERQERFAGIAQQTMKALDPSGENPKGQLDAEAQRASAYRPPESFNGQEVIAAYYAMIELIDHEFGRLLDGLEAMGQLDDTLIVFMSDHGELLGDHGLLYKGCRFFEGLVHVPLIMAWGGEIREGLESDALVELVDIAPTLLEAAGIEVPGFMQGRSLLPLLGGSSDPHRFRDHVVSEFNDALGSAAIPAPSHGTMVFDGRYKLVLHHGTPEGELFDLERDPGEFDDLYHDPEAAELRCRLMRRHVDAMMATSWAGPERVAIY